MAYDGKPEPKMVKKGKKQVDQVVDIRTMLNDFGVSAMEKEIQTLKEFIHEKF